jgi:hypothetical protein
MAVRAAVHSKGNEHGLRHVVIQRLPGDSFNHLSKVNETFAGITKSLSRGEMNRQRLAIPPPIGKAGAVAQDDARGDIVKPRVALNVRLGKIFRQGRIQV